MYVCTIIMKNILDSGETAIIQQRMQKLDENSCALWGKMKVNEMLAHLNDSFRITFGMKSYDDKSNFFRNKLVFPVVVYWLKNWPAGLPAPKEIRQQHGGTPAKDFYTEYAYFCKMLEVFQEREETKLQAHPLFGKLSKKQWADLYSRHIDHHLKQFGV